MKRDMHLVREILLYAETEIGWDNQNVVIPDCTNEELIYHISMMVDAGLVHGSPMMKQIYAITWDGQNFLELIREEAVWEKVLEVCKVQEYEIIRRLAQELYLSEAIQELNEEAEQMPVGLGLGQDPNFCDEDSDPL